jgi:glucosamine--fructose-6-phosphate aminotransferase (isomerizing)
MDKTVRQISSIAEEMAAFLAEITPIHLLARGASQGAAMCGRLVLEEVARQPAVALEAAEFRQGPNEVIDENFGAVLYTGHGETVALTRSLAKEIHSYRGKVIAVGAEEAVRDLPGLLVPLPAVAEVFAPVLEVVPVQGLAFKLAEKKGIEPGTVRYISKIIKEEAVNRQRIKMQQRLSK